MADRALIARELAAFLLSGAWTKRRLQARAKQYLGKGAPRALTQLIDDALAAVTAPYPPAPDYLARTLMESRSFDIAARRLLRTNQPLKVLLHSPVFAPVPAFAGLPVPKLERPGDLAAWLGLPIDKIEWLADIRRGHARAATSPLQHYSYTFAPKREGPPRLIESPKPQIKAVQRRILREILDHAPTHPSAHGFVKRRSCISGAQRHAGEHVVVRLDLKRFFPRVQAMRVHGLFRAIGFPWASACLLTGLCTTCTPSAALAAIGDWQVRQEYAAPHLPQGAPTSPALANLCAWRLDQRLSGLARRLGVNYSRYADDLTFSGDHAFARTMSGFLSTVETIVREEGFALNTSKTRVMHASSAQRVTGIVVNKHVNAARTDYDALKAILHNCKTSGDPAAQNRASHPDFKLHLEGRIGWVEQINPHRGLKLRLIFDQINWRG
ncbi:MAG TPA: reverse transcriptase family protein [Caulobacterales bacterium]|nr:reverse transcriptase family protein [Caulobacterales bacterium]